MTTSSERRTAILRAATRLFEHYGHGKTTIADVAREAHVGVGTVYLEFDSKEAIVQELSLSAHVGVLEAMRGAMRAQGDAPSRLSAVLQERTRTFLELRKRGQHACELLHCKNEAVRGAHQRFRDEERELFAGIIEDGVRAGVFAECDPGAIAQLIQRAFTSLSPPYVFGSDDDATRAADELCRLLLHGLLAAKVPSALSSSRGRGSAGRTSRAATNGAPARRSKRQR